MSLFDAWEKFYSQIYPQHYLDDDEETNLIESNEETIVTELEDTELEDTELEDNSYCSATIAASQLVEYVIYIQNYLWNKKQN
jgi:hypothetical protein